MRTTKYWCKWLWVVIEEYDSMNVENWFDFKEEDLAVEKANSLRIRVHLKIKKMVSLPKSPLGPRTILFLNIKLCCSSVRFVWVNILQDFCRLLTEKEKISRYQPCGRQCCLQMAPLSEISTNWKLIERASALESNSISNHIIVQAWKDGSAWYYNT